MNWLNYHHLLYFWVVSKEGTLAAASDRLHLAQPTLSSQIKKLEKSIGVKLFERQGRGLKLTDQGQIAFRYADEIFSLGLEMTDAIQGIPADGQLQLKVGVPDVLPKLVVFRLLEPALTLDIDVHLETYEGKFDDLLGDLATHRLDVLISETPLPPGARVRAFNHRLGGCTLTCFGTPELQSRYRRKFPKSLDGAPMLLPTQNTVLRRAIEQWFDKNEVRPIVRHEFEDSALLKVFGQSGAGLFLAPTAIKKAVMQQYGVKAVGEAEVRDNFFAISVERRLKHPAVIAICESARTELFEE